MIGRYYDWLSWFQRATSWIGQGGGYQSLTVHRLLTSSDPTVAGADVVHERILEAVRPFDSLRAGPARRRASSTQAAGSAARSFYLHRRLGGQYDGLTLSPTQRAHAEREARRRNVAAACRFHLRSYDDDLRVVVPEGADLVVAIESLAHATHPARSIANLADALRPGGRLVVVDDVPDDDLVESDGDFAGFRERLALPGDRAPRDDPGRPGGRWPRRATRRGPDAAGQPAGSSGDRAAHRKQPTVEVVGRLDGSRGADRFAATAA